MTNHPQNKFCCISRKRRSSGRRHKLEDFFPSTHSVRLIWKHKRGGGEGVRTRLQFNEPEDLMNYPSYPLVFLQFTSKRSNTKTTPTIICNRHQEWSFDILNLFFIHNSIIVMVFYTTLYVRLTFGSPIFSRIIHRDNTFDFQFTKHP